MPNGVFFQRAGWAAQCAVNKRRFAGLGRTCGLVVFASGARAGNNAMQAFSGTFVSGGGTVVDGNSPGMAVVELRGRALLRRAAELAEKWGQEEVLAREAGGTAIWVVKVERVRQNNEAGDEKR